MKMEIKIMRINLSLLNKKQKVRTSKYKILKSKNKVMVR